MSTPIRVLQIEDSESDSLLIERALRRADFAPECSRVEFETDMVRMLQSGTWDVIIADYTMPHFSGLEAFRVYRESGLDIPFIIVSGSIGEEIAVETMKAGIHDYVMKSNLARLAPAVRRELREAAVREAQRQSVAKLRQTERMRTIGELTASLIHDLKNPLQAILGSSELLLSEEIDEQGRQKYCNIISRQVDRMLSMSQDVLDFAKGEVRLNVRMVNPRDLLQEIVDTYTDTFATAGVTLRFCCDAVPGAPECIPCDEQKIWRALHNLIANAKDAMRENGVIDLVVRCDRSHVILEVSDNGPGIPEEICERLFDPFVTHGKRHGTGLGLTIVKNVIEAHGGMVTFESSRGVGTRFILTLPVDPRAGTGSESDSLGEGERRVQVYS